MLFRLSVPTDGPRLRELSETTFRDTYTAYNTPENIEKHVSKNFSIEQIQQELQNSATQ